MRIVVTGATGNVGTSVVRALAGDPRVDAIVGIARRRPGWSPARTTWVAADVVSDDLRPHFDGADAVIHLAWQIQPARDLATLGQINVEGSRRVFQAAADAGVGRLVYASSVGVYSPGPVDAPVGESFARDGVPSSFYARHKAAVERALDELEGSTPLQVVRLRPGLIFQRDAASEIHRYFLGPLIPRALVRPQLVPILPLPRGFAVQAVHATDVAAAYRLAALDPDAHGPYNIAADPVLDAHALGQVLGARPVTVPAAALRALVDVSWRLRLQPTPPGWFDLGLQTPVMDTSRARDQLGWSPQHSSLEALEALLGGLRSAAAGPTPPLRTGVPILATEGGRKQ